MGLFARLGPVVSVVLAVACSRPSVRPASPEPGPASIATEDDAVLVTVFLHELRHMTPGTTAICLRVRPNQRDIGDPDDAVLAGVRRRFPEARGASECVGGGPDAPVQVKSTGANAVMLDIGPVRRDGPDRATVGGGGVGAGGTWHIREVDYDLVREAGGWRVTSERVTFIN